MTGRLLPILLISLVPLAVGFAQEPTVPPYLPDAPFGCPQLPVQPCLPPKRYLVEEQTETLKHGLKIVDEVVGFQQQHEVAYREEERLITQMVVKTSQVPQQVPCTTPEPYQTVDPCTGHCKTEYHEIPSLKTVYVTVHETVPETVKVIVKIPYLKAGQIMTVSKLKAIPTAEAAISTRLRIITAPACGEVETCPAQSADMLPLPMKMGSGKDADTLPPPRKTEEKDPDMLPPPRRAGKE